MSAGPFREIWESPEDDAPRLVYADWLEDHGDAERAELIRVQCRLARLGPDDPEREGLEERELDLLGRRGDEWSAELPAWARAEAHAFRRGFVGEVSLTLPRLLRNGPALFRAHPIDAMDLGGLEGRTGDLTACPLLEQVSRLRLSYSGIDETTLPAVLASPHLGALRELELPYCRPETCGETLAAWPGLARLRRLDLDYASLTDLGLDALLRSPNLGPLEELSLGGCDGLRRPGRILAAGPGLGHLRRLDLSVEMRDDDLADLAASRHLTRLEELTLNSDSLSGRGVAALARSDRLPALRRLELTVVNGGEEIAEALAGGRFESLRRLGLHYIGIGDGGLAALAKARWLAGLRSLTVAEEDIEDAGVLALARSKHVRGLAELALNGAAMELDTLQRMLSAVPGLTSLGLEDCEAIREDVSAFTALLAGRVIRKLSLESYLLKSDGARELVRSPHLAGLRQLDLEGVPLAAGVVELARSPHLANLTRLGLVRCQLYAGAVRVLAESPNLPRLRALDLGQNDVGPEGARALAESPCLRLAYLKVGYSSVNRDSRRLLMKRFGGRVLRWR